MRGVGWVWGDRWVEVVLVEAQWVEVVMGLRLGGGRLVEVRWWQVCRTY